MVKDKSINLENIFSLFEYSDHLNKNQDIAFIDLTNTPIYWVGMFKKLLINYGKSGHKIVKSLRLSNPHIDPREMIEAGDYIIFDRAYTYIENIDITNLEHMQVLEKFLDEDFIFTISWSLSHFEKYEEYEKCYHLKQILNFLEKKVGV
jgi:hypothetical protein